MVHVHYVVLDVKDVASKKRKIENNLDVSHSSEKLNRENVFSKTGIPKPINIVHTEKVKETNFSFSSKKQACFEVREKDVNSVNMKPESENVSEPLLSDISGFNKFDIKQLQNLTQIEEMLIARALPIMKEHGIPNDLKVIESVNEDVRSDNDIGEDSSIDYEEIVYNKSTETSSVIPDIGNDLLQCEAIRTALLNNKIDWPELEEKPLNE
ncbi:Hypothetical predicted protein [Paramuricea clavata]|uniref:Uncharacterized protein n=1 Tax=Paramuricea clavata TaxID=317549 RepID=A0A7D9HDY3_PARCT|nr:Hypothetical predicted protein [Paramuricea clavata]